ncbi:hypothetical protein MBLNU459_g0991t1 [Dothideomycetes sp. NU459]
MVQHHLASPKPAPSTPLAQSDVQSRRDLTSWWRNFKRGNAKLQDEKATQGIFGVPLQTSIRYANVAISLFNDEGQSYIYGYVPIVVAKSTDVEGIFRLSGSEKRIKELRVAFDSPDRYGKGLDWGGYTVHDAANILRRYFNQLPEPIIPLEFYERFREPLKNHQAQAVGAMDLQGPELGQFEPAQAIRAYQALITELPPLNRQLLLYILDLLAVFASKSDLNKMTTPNLAAIFQPGLLSHPQHDMAPAEYRLSQDVLIFLIENQDHFLIGMHGTAADEKTVQEVQSGLPSPRTPPSPSTPGRSKTVIGRSSSNASAGADSVRRFGNIRRNVSVSSKTSKRSTGVSAPITPTAMPSPTPTSGVHRSNTVPSKRSANASPRFQREKSLDPPTPSPTTLLPPVIDTAVQNQPSDESTPIATAPPPSAFNPVSPPEVISPSSSEATTPLAAPGSDTSSAGLIAKDYQTPQKTAEPALAPSSTTPRDPSVERSASGTPTRAFLDIFKPSGSGSDGDKRDGRRPNKLQKKRIPGSALSSAQSSAHSLQHGADGADEYSLTTPLTPNAESQAPDYSFDHGHEQSAYATAQTSPRQSTPQRTHTETTLRPTVSPSHSYHSHTSVTDTSDADYPADLARASAEKTEKKRRWRFSQQAGRTEQTNTNAGVPPTIGTLAGTEQQSRSTLGSAGYAARGPRRSFQEPTGTPADPEALLSDTEERKKGPMSWIRGKLAERNERKERDAEKDKRAQSPNKLPREANASGHSLVQSSAERRGKSLEVPRGKSQVVSPEIQKTADERTSPSELAEQ